MQVVVDLSLSVPFAPPSAVRTFLDLQGSAGTFRYRPSEVYTPTRGMCMMSETHLSVSLHNAVHTPCTFLSLELVHTLLRSSIALLRTLRRASDSHPPPRRSTD
jgi:hypothetical protein